MRAVNLLPRAVTLSSRAKPTAAVIGAIAAPFVAGGLVLAGYAFEHSAVTSARGRLAAVQAQVAAIPHRVSTQPAPNSTLALEQQSRRSALDAALASRIPWDATLVDLARVLPADVWLTSLALTSPTPADSTAPTGAASTSAFTIQGFTYSQDSVARLLTRLQLLPILSNVTLATTAASTVGLKPVVQFTVNAAITPPASEPAT